MIEQKGVVLFQTRKHLKGQRLFLILHIEAWTLVSIRTQDQSRRPGRNSTHQVTDFLNCCACRALYNTFIMDMSNDTVHSSDRARKEDLGILEDLFVDEIREFNEEHGVNE